MLEMFLSIKQGTWNVSQQNNKQNDATQRQILRRIINCILQRRYIVALLGSMCTAIIYSHRLNISIAMVAMVKSNSDTNKNWHRNATKACPAFYDSETLQSRSRGEFEWSPELQGFIISAGYLEYFITQIPGGILAKIYGSKRPVVAGLLIASACNFLSPIAARENPYILMALTLIRGMGQGIMLPAISVLMSEWFPKNERGVLCTFVNNGYPIGVVITGLVGGKLCDLEFMGGWPLIFYVFGFLSTVLAVSVIIFYYDSPEDDPRISETELKHIQNNQEKKVRSECPPIPWFNMLMSVPTLALIVGLIGSSWMNCYFVSVHPIYVRVVLNIPISKVGILSATPFLLQTIAGFLTCYYLCGNKRFSEDTLRRGMNSFSVLLFTAGLLGVYFAKCSIILSEVFKHIALFGLGFSAGGSVIAAVDMSPTFCGPLTGFASTMASLAGLLVPIVAGILTNDEQSLSQWGKVFISVMGVCFGSGLIFQLFGSAEIQPYDPTYIKCSDDNQPKEEKDESEGAKNS